MTADGKDVVFEGDRESNVVDFLIAERRRQKVTRAAITKSTGISKSAQSRFEKRKNVLHFDKLELYADRLGYKVMLIKKEII
jgi:transcriptional regulator with XRE-family HTH domain